MPTEALASNCDPLNTSHAGVFGESLDGNLSLRARVRHVFDVLEKFLQNLFQELDLVTSGGGSLRGPSDGDVRRPLRVSEAQISNETTWVCVIEQRLAWMNGRVWWMTGKEAY